jgi:predicted Ser/Thr protein kinase
MAIFLHAILFSVFGSSIEAARVHSVTMVRAHTIAAGDCSKQITFDGRQVVCRVVKPLSGGRQANTNIVNIDGKVYVMKETSDPITVGNLREEKKIITHLKGAQHQVKMPQYHLAFQARKENSEVLVMEYLDGWFDLNSAAAPQESYEIREVRAAAFFLALDSLYKAKVSHCDLNPGNAMFNRKDPTRCKIIDFGMAAINYGAPGTCIAVNGMPDLGYDGAAWQQIYARLGAPRGPNTLYSLCGKRCDTQRIWAAIVGQARTTVDSFRQKVATPTSKIAAGL